MAAPDMADVGDESMGDELPPDDGLPPDEPPPEEEEKPIEAINILPLLMKAAPKWTERIAKKVITDAIDDNETRDDYMKRYAAQLKLFAGSIPNLGYPAQGAKAPHIAIMTKAILHLWARIYDQVIPAKGDIVKGKPLGYQDEARALRVEKHMNWQLRYRMPDWGTSHQVSILAWIMAGSTFRHYRWDPILHTHAIDHVPIDDVIISYTESDIHPQMKDVHRVTRVLRQYQWEMERYEEEGYYSNLDAVFPDRKKDGEEDGSTTDGDTTPSTTDDKDSVVREAADKVQGLEAPKKPEKDGKREVYAQNTFVKFPSALSSVKGAEALAGVTKPVTITVDKLTRKPVSFTIREEPDPVDQARFAQEMAAFKQAAANVGVQGAMPGMTPAAPKEPRPVRMQTVYTIIHYRLFPNPSGFYGLGIGWLLESSNELANVLAAEYMLSGKFYNMYCGWLARGAKEKRGDLQMTHGKFIETDLDPELLDKGIKTMDARPPSDSLMRVVEKLEANSEIAANADILSGEKGASNETAKGMMVRNSNAMALISVMTRIYLDPLKYELKLVAHANSIYLDETEYFPFAQDVPGKPGQQEMVQEKVGRQDYIEDVHLEFTADARMSSKPERIADAKDFAMMILNSPLAQNAMLVHFAFQRIFTVAEAPEYVAAMGPPPTPPPPPKPMAQENENAGFFNETDHPVLDDDNHVEHLAKIEELEQSPLAKEMSSTGKQMMDRHKRAHISRLYLQMQALQEETGVNVHALAAGGGIPGVGAGPAGGENAGPPGRQTPGGASSPSIPGPNGDARRGPPSGAAGGGP